MHQAPSLLEVSPLRDESRKSQKRPMSAGSTSTDHRRASTTSSSSQARKDTMSSTTTTATAATTAVSVNTNGEPSYGATESASPTYSSQAVFSARDGADIAGSRRPSRRRTGPLSASQREKAALIRKLGACNDCRRRRVAVSSKAFGPPAHGLGNSQPRLLTVPSEPPQHELGRCREEIQKSYPGPGVCASCRSPHQPFPADGVAIPDRSARHGH